MTLLVNSNNNNYGGDSEEDNHAIINLLYLLLIIAELAHTRPCHGDQSHPGHRHTPQGQPCHPQNGRLSQELLPPVKTIMN